MKTEEFDNLGRIIKCTESVTGTVYEYDYPLDSLRIVTIINEKNTSNFKTIKEQKLIDGEYIDVEMKQFGSLYNIVIKYIDKRAVYYERVNLETGKINKRRTAWKDNKPCIWTTEYDGEKHMGFYVNRNILTATTTNI